MYHTHFGLNRLPFVPSAAGPAFYASGVHEHALQRLAEAVLQQESLVLLTGPAGTGKTLLTHQLFEQLDAHWVRLWIPHSRLQDCSALFQAMLYDLDQPYGSRSEQELRLKVIEVLLQLYKQEKHTLLVLDEAQHLQPVLLEELRLLTNLETPLGKALQVVLVGQSAVLRILRAPELAVLEQRLAVRIELTPLDFEGSCNYIRHHLRAAGGKPEEIVTGEAMELLARAGRGVPRLLNQATHLSLQTAFLGEQALVDAEAALEAIHDLGLSQDVGDVSVAASCQLAAGMQMAS